MRVGCLWPVWSVEGRGRTRTCFATFLSSFPVLVLLVESAVVQPEMQRFSTRDGCVCVVWCLLLFCIEGNLTGARYSHM